MKEKNKNTKALFTNTGLLGFFTVLVFAALTAGISWILYEHTVTLLTENLRERLLSIARTASVEFSVDDLNKLQVEDDWKRPEWPKVVNQLKKVRLNNDNILFAYIFRKNKNDSTKLEFVSDSHSINPFAKIDLNNDGKIDDADTLQWPSQPYDDPPSEAFLGFVAPVTSDLYEDQWGTEITGYSPIKDDNNKTIAVLAIDMKAGDFFTITQQTLYPFLIFILALTALLMLLTAIIIYIWDKRIQLLAEVDRQKDELLSIVSHQLATPISAIKWNLEMMLDGDMGKLTKEQEENVKSLQNISGDLSDLVSMILDVSRVQLGRMRMDKQELDLAEFFKEILEVIQPKSKEKKVHFNISLPEHMPKAMLDKRYTRMTVENLLSNAVKYTPTGGDVDFKVEIKDDTMYCQVKDTGVGIPKSERDKIFGKMFRASNVRNTVDGNGFGLYVAKGAIEAQGGQIWFESEEGKGTTFFVELPLK
jgi:signal transduction histidine kinase